MTASRSDASAHPAPVPPVPGYVLRRATLRDVRAVRRLERAIFPLDAYPYFDLVLLFLWPTIRNLKIVAPDGTLAGFAAGIPARRVRDRAWIVTIGIAPVHQRRGLGAWLLDASERTLERRCIRLTVRESNRPAIRLYHKTGYRTIDRRPGYYHDGEAGLIMEKCRLAEGGSPPPGG